VDVLERVLDKGIVIAGDVFVQLADIDLLRIRLRLVICSVEKAEQIGLDWWRTDSAFGAPGRARTGALPSGESSSVPAAELNQTLAELREERRRLADQMTRLEQLLGADSPSRADLA
jgi:hypothetical protein